MKLIKLQIWLFYIVFQIFTRADGSCIKTPNICSFIIKVNNNVIKFQSTLIKEFTHDQHPPKYSYIQSQGRGLSQNFRYRLKKYVVPLKNMTEFDKHFNIWFMVQYTEWPQFVHYSSSTHKTQTIRDTENWLAPLEWTTRQAQNISMWAPFVAPRKSKLFSISRHIFFSILSVTEATALLNHARSSNSLPNLEWNTWSVT